MQSHELSPRLKPSYNKHIPRDQVHPVHPGNADLEALPRNAFLGIEQRVCSFDRWLVTGGSASRKAFPGCTWERVKRVNLEIAIALF